MRPSLIKVETVEGRLPSTPSDFSESASSRSTSEEVDQLGCEEEDESRSRSPERKLSLKLEGAEIAMAEPSQVCDGTQHLPDRTGFTPDITSWFTRNSYQEVSEIAYNPESAVEEGMKLITVLQQSVRKLAIDNKAREDSWRREIEALTAQGPATTIIAVCGATGVGKSSVLNAILEAKVMPTSCSQACTSVVTEISFHDEATIVGEVCFLSAADWKAEISTLLSDLVGDDGPAASRRPIDTRSPAGAAWSKIHAVYPQVKFEELIRMTVHQVMALDHKVTRMLGVTKELVADSAESFSRMIREYIDSSFLPAERLPSSTKGRLRPPAFWPLISQVRILCNAKALSTGAVLVDLPGVGDSNAARNRIAKDYMKKANCVWILAPMVRAVDDKIARDLLGEAFKVQLMSAGCVKMPEKYEHCTKPHMPALIDGSYDDHSVTFIATKCDDVQCSEVIEALDLENDAGFRDIGRRITDLNAALANLEATEMSRSIKLKARNDSLEQLQEEQRRIRDRIETVQRNSVMDGLGKRKRDDFTDMGRPPKRLQLVDATTQAKDICDYTQSDHELETDRSENTLHELELTLSQCDQDIRRALLKVHSADKKLRKLDSEKWGAHRQLEKARRERKAYCSLQRSKHSRHAIMEDFRSGLRELEGHGDAADHDAKDYDDVHLPVFTCSSKDFLILSKLTEEMGEETCFINVEDTGVPALQQWCHRLTIASRERVARTFLTRLSAFSTTLKTYAQGVGNVTAGDRALLQGRWETADIDELQDLIKELRESRGQGKEHGDSGTPNGIAVRLCEEFSELVDICVENLKTQLKRGLSQRCRDAAVKAAAAALTTVDKFAAESAWNTYRATLIRNGNFHFDLNSALAVPFTKALARSWNAVFRNLNFSAFEKEVMTSISTVLQEFQASAAIGLQDRAKIQSDACLDEAKALFKECMQTVKAKTSSTQKAISRKIAPHVQRQLHDGYERAVTACGTGRGSAQRRKGLFREFVDQHKERVFEEGSEVVLKSIGGAAESIGEVLDYSLCEMAQKIEINMSTLWEAFQDDPAQIKARQNLGEVATHTCCQLELWLEAARIKQEKDKLEFDAALRGHLNTPRSP